MGKREEFKAALKDALKAQDKIKMSTLRLITAALKEKDIHARAEGRDDGISEAEILSLLQSMIKQRNESVKTYEDAGRLDMAEQEAKEIEIINGFLPAQLSEEDMKAAIQKIIDEKGASSIKDMGAVMADLKAQYAGQIDMGKASGAVKALLS